MRRRQRRPFFARRRPCGGFSLVEILIATLAAVPIVLGLALFFGKMTKATQFTKDQTTATYFANAQLEALKGLPYHRLLVSSTTAAIPGVDASPRNRFDPVNYPEESQTVGPVTFRRYVYVEKIQRSTGDVLEVLAATATDTGLKRVNQTVVWRSGAIDKIVHYSNIINKLQTDETRGQYVLTGVVVDTNSLPIPNAIVQDVYAPQFAARTDASGRYRVDFSRERINTLIWISSLPYATQSFTQTVGPAVPIATHNATLSVYPASQITLTAWRSTHPVIASVMGKTVDASLGGFPVEYVALLNPTTNTVTAAGRLGLRFQRPIGANTGQDPGPQPIEIRHIAPSFGYKSYYLIANTTAFRVNGYNVVADAVWVATSANNQAFFSARRTGSSVFTAANPNVIPVYGDDSGTNPGDQHEGAGGLQLYDLVSGEVYDTVGWKGGGGTPATPGLYETAPFDGPPEGIREDYIFHRFVSTEGFAGSNWVLGPSFVNCHAYDTDDNSVNWGEQPLWSPNIGPRTSSDGATCRMRSGSPWPGTTLWFQDRFHNTTTHTAVLVTLPNGRSYAGVTIRGDAEATTALSKWLVGSKDGAWGRTEFTEGMGLPPSPAAYRNPYVVLDHPTTLGGTLYRGPKWITGKLLNQNGQPFTGVVYLAAQFDYYPPGYFPFPNQANPQTGEYRYFVSQGLDAGVNLWAWQGTISDGAWRGVSYFSHPVINLNLTGPTTHYANVNITAFEGGGSIRGFVTTDGVAPVPGIKVRVTNTTGGGSKNAFTGDDGYFAADFMSTGTYAVVPQMTSGEVCSPASATVVVSAVTGYFSSTFTYGSPFGTVSGRVSDALQANGAGATVIVSTHATAAAALLTLDASRRGAGLRYYMGVSDNRGDYRVRVRQGTGYYVHCFHTRVTNGAPVLLSATAGPVNVAMGSAVNGVDFSW